MVGSYRDLRRLHFEKLQRCAGSSSSSSSSSMHPALHSLLACALIVETTAAQAAVPVKYGSFYKSVSYLVAESNDTDKSFFLKAGLNVTYYQV